MSQCEVATCRDKCRYVCRVKTDEQRGPFAAWLRRARTAARPGLPKGWKVDEAVRHLERAVPGVSFAVYREIEAGTRRPSDEQMRAIEHVFGKVPDFTKSERAGASSDPALSQLLKPLVSALSDLVVELRAARQERADLLERVEALETAAKLQDPPDAGAVDDPTAPVQRGE